MAILRAQRGAKKINKKKHFHSTILNQNSKSPRKLHSMLPFGNLKCVLITCQKTEAKLSKNQNMNGVSWMLLVCLDWLETDWYD